MMTYTPLTSAYAEIVVAYSAQAKPNVLLVYTDDYGWVDLGANGVDTGSVVRWM